MTTIIIHITDDTLDGYNYTLDRATFTAVYEELVRKAILADYPDAEIEVEQVHASGCTPRDEVLDADGMRDDDLTDYYLAEVTGRAWQAAHEALA